MRQIVKYLRTESLSIMPLPVLVLIVFALVSANLKAQDLKKDMLEMNRYLMGLQDFRLTVDYQVEDSLKEGGSVSVFVSEKGLFYQLEGAEILINHQNTIIVDEQNRSLIYSNNETKKGKKRFQVEEDLLKGLDTLIAAADSVYFQKTNEDKRMYFLRLPKQYFSLVEITFKGKMIEKVSYHYNPDFIDGQQGVRTVNHLKVEEKPEMDLQLLDSAFYLKKEGEEVLPTENFKNYILVFNESSEEYFK